MRSSESSLPTKQKNKQTNAKTKIEVPPNVRKLFLKLIFKL